MTHTDAKLAQLTLVVVCGRQVALALVLGAHQPHAAIDGEADDDGEVSDGTAHRDGDRLH